MSDSKLTPPADVSAMTLRECRLIVERLFVAAGAHPGIVPSARDFTVAAETLGLGALRAIFEDADLIDGALVPRVTEGRPHASCISVDGHGALSLYVGAAVRDLLLENGADAVVHVRNVIRPEWLAAVATTPGLESVVIEAAKDEDGVLLRHERDEKSAARRADLVAVALRNAVTDGLPADTDLWFGLYSRSNGALAEDSALSRRHAGYRDVDDEGRIVKQMDDDSDLENALRLQSAS